MPKPAPTMALLLTIALLAGAEGIPLDRSIQDAIDDPGTPFRLEVYCLNDQRRRSFVVFRGAVAVWQGAWQVRLDNENRGALLRLLLDADFAGFEARYGEQKKADRQEAPLRVSCRVSLAISGNEKTSVQLLEGVQSPDLLGLAGDLLDRIEPLAASGESTTSLEDALEKLKDGVLAPEVLDLRLLRLPEDSEDGFILRIRGGEISRQPYAPGTAIGDVHSRPVDRCTMDAIITAQEDAAVWSLPRNLRHTGTTELDVGVLGSRQNVQARSTFRAADADAQARFNHMIRQFEILAEEFGNQVEVCPE